MTEGNIEAWIGKSPELKRDAGPFGRIAALRRKEQNVVKVTARSKQAVEFCSNGAPQDRQNK